MAPQDDWSDTLDNTDTPFIPPLAHWEAVLGSVPALVPRSDAAEKQGEAQGLRGAGAPLGGGRQGYYRHPLERLLQELRYTETQLNAPQGTLPQPLVSVVMCGCVVQPHMFDDDGGVTGQHSLDGQHDLKRQINQPFTHRLYSPRDPLFTGTGRHPSGADIHPPQAGGHGSCPGRCP